MDEVKYKPYEEWWKEEVSLKDFCMSLSHLVHTFDQNLSTFPNGKNMTRKEWMETFLQWLDYEE